MTLTQPIVIAPRTQGHDGRGMMAVALAALLLFSVIAAMVFVGAHSASPQASAHQPPPVASPIVNVQEPACAAALAKARDTRGLPTEEAIAASTAMLRACEVR